MLKEGDIIELTEGMIMSKTCYSISCGEYSDYKILAIFTSAEKAEQALPVYLTSTTPSGYFYIEEFPLDPVVKMPPPGCSAFRATKALKEDVIKLYEEAPIEIHGNGSAVYTANGLSPRIILYTFLFAKDEQHAIKIASERFTQYEAKQPGIA